MHGDLAFAARLHLQALPGGFFADLGERFLRSYYDTFVDSPYGAALVAEIDGGPVGALLGTVDNRKHWAWVVRHRGWELALRVLLALVVRPPLAWRFLRTRVRRYLRAVLRLVRRSTASHGLGQVAAEADGDGAAAGVTIAVLMHVSVLSQARRCGAGAALVGRFVDAARGEGADVAELVTRANEAGAGGFYRRLGWEHRRDRAGHDGVRLSEFVLDLRGGGPDGASSA